DLLVQLAQWRVAEPVQVPDADDAVLGAGDSQRLLAILAGTGDGPDGALVLPGLEDLAAVPDVDHAVLPAGEDQWLLGLVADGQRGDGQRAVDRQRLHRGAEDGRLDGDLHALTNDPVVLAGEEALDAQTVEVLDLQQRVVGPDALAGLLVHVNDLAV